MELPFSVSGLGPTATYISSKPFTKQTPDLEKSHLAGLAVLIFYVSVMGKKNGTGVRVEDEPSGGDGIDTNGGNVEEEDAIPVDADNNPLFVAPMQLCRPSICHTYLEAVPETLRALRAVTAGVAVVAGVGSQRIGKSTILNLLHSRKTSGFGVL